MKNSGLKIQKHLPTESSQPVDKIYARRQIGNLWNIKSLMQKWSWASLTVDFSLTSDKTTEKNKERLTITDEAQQPPIIFKADKGKCFGIN